MKKAVLALIVSMLAVPALAGVTVDCEIDGNEVTITYAIDGGDANLPSAFGLDIIANGDISMDTTLPSADINDSDYYIYPGSIDINADGTVDDYGSPVAVLDANTMTIEMSSFYVADDPVHNTAPPASGWLIKFRVNKTSSNVFVDLKENVERGGVVMEVDYNFPGGYVVCDECSSDGGPYTISGTVTYMGSGLSGVTMNGFPSVPVTNGSGFYTETVPYGWSGTVAPQKTGYGFKPTSRDYNDVPDDQNDHNYCAYPGCWDYPTQCYGDATGDGYVSISDWPAFRDSFLKCYPAAGYMPCGDFSRDGCVNISDWPGLRNWFMLWPPPDCPPGDINGVYCP